MASTIILAGLTLEVFFLLAHGANRVIFGDGYFFAIDHDQGLAAWATSALFTITGVVCGLLAWFNRAARAPFAALAVVGLGLSMEQVVQLHGGIETSVSGSKLLEIAIGIAVVAVIVFAAARLAAPHRLLLLASIPVLALSALASQANQSLDLPHAGVIFFQAAEECLEIAMAIVILAAVVEPLWSAVSRAAVDARRARPAV